MRERMSAAFTAIGLVLVFWTSFWIFASKFYGNEYFLFEYAGAAFMSFIGSSWKIESLPR